MKVLCPWAVTAIWVSAVCGQVVGQVATIEVAAIPGRKVPFQSHNQKVVQNAHGIFATRGDRDNPHFWLNRSTDGGRTFTTVYEEDYGVSPPTLETDENNNLYMIFPTTDSKGTRFLKFTSGSFSSPAINKTTTAAGSAGKFASFYDRSRGLLYHATQWGRFLVFNKSGSLQKNKHVYTSGGSAGPSYPHLFVDENGVIHYAMTTADSDSNPYQTIRYVKSTNGGDTWRKMDGTVLSIPTSCDSGGPSTMINLADEVDLNTWLGNMHVKNGKVHFMYTARGVSPERQHYMRFNASTGVREIDSYSDWGNRWGNPKLHSQHGDGSFASDPDDPTGPLFAVGRYPENQWRKRLVALVSYDNGSTWQNHAITPSSGSGDISDGELRDVGGCRSITPDGNVIGSLAADRPSWATCYYYEFTSYILPEITNAGGAENVDETSARLNGNLVSNGGDAATQVTVYYGPSNGGTTKGNWAESQDLGAPGEGPLSADVSGLTPGTTYYYRYYASNGRGDDWAPSSTPFTTLGRQEETTTLLTSSANPALLGSVLTLTATVQTNGVTASGATGTVVFTKDGQTVLGSDALVNGVAQLTTGTLPYGTNAITAEYGGSLDYAASTNTPPLLQVITNPAHRVTLTRRIGAGSDDAEESPTGSMNITSGDLDMVHDESEPDAGDQAIGLRFGTLDIPHGAYIVDARVQFTAEEVQTNASALTIQAEAADDAHTFSAAPSNITSRALTVASVAWSPHAWETIGEAGPPQRTPNLATLLQEVVDRRGWMNSNAVAFVLTGTGDRTADSFEKSGGSPARLTVTYDVPGTPISMATSVDVGSDDAEESPGGTINLTSGDLDIVHDETEPDAGDQTIGIRFTGLNIPRGWEITQAGIQFTADEVQTGACDLLFRGQAADDAEPFSAGTSNISTRAVTTATVSWQPPPWNTIGESGPAQQTPDLAPLLQEIVRRPGWHRGNATAFIITGTGDRTADAVDKNGGTPARLTVVFQYAPPPLRLSGLVHALDREVTLRWLSLAGKTYTIMASSNLHSWISVTSGVPAGGGATSIAIPPGADPDPATEPKLYFRVSED